MVWACFQLYFRSLVQILKILPLQRSHLNLSHIDLPILRKGLFISISVTKLLLDEGVSEYFELCAVLTEFAVVETLYLLDLLHEFIDPLPHFLLRGLSLYKFVN